MLFSKTNIVVLGAAYPAPARHGEVPPHVSGPTPQVSKLIKCTIYIYQLNASIMYTNLIYQLYIPIKTPIKCSNEMHQLNASDVPQFSPNDLLSFRPPTDLENLCHRISLNLLFSAAAQ